MLLSTRYSKAILTSHITFSVGWLGAVVVFLALAITGLNSQDALLARAAYIAMEQSAWLVIVPFCLASLFTGIAQAVFTKWGLFRHYWIIVKLFLTVSSTILLLLHLKPISYLAGIATAPSFSNAQETELIIDLITKAGAAIVVLLVITTISIYKPWGKIPFKKVISNQSDIKVIEKKTATSWRFYLLLAVICLVILFILKHLFGGGMQH